MGCVKGLWWRSYGNLSHEQKSMCGKQEGREASKPEQFSSVLPLRVFLLRQLLVPLSLLIPGDTGHAVVAKFSPLVESFNSWSRQTNIAEHKITFSSFLKLQSVFGVIIFLIQAEGNTSTPWVCFHNLECHWARYQIHTTAILCTPTLASPCGRSWA